MTRKKRSHYIMEFAQAGQLGEALVLYRMYPDAYLAASLIPRFVRLMDIETVLEVFDILPEHDTITVFLLIEAGRKCKKQALVLDRAMRALENGVVPDSQLCNSLAAAIR